MYKSSSSVPSQRRSHKLRKSLLTASCCNLILLLALQANGQNQEGAVVARIDSRAITIEEVDGTVAAQIYALQQQLFAIRKTALESLIDRRLIEAEAAKKNISVDQLKVQWTEGRVKVESSRIEELYQKNSAAFGQMSTDEAKEKLRLDLESQARLKQYRAALAELRQRAELELLLEEPRLSMTYPLRTAYSTGSLKPKVLILEFSDFQCPFCREAQANLKAILEKYAGEVKLEFRNLPLEIHPMASLAARAAYCAGKQESFWSFHDALFKINDLTADSINKIAINLNLNVSAFESCVSSEEPQQAIAADIREARRLGITGTPSYVINGKLFQGVLSIKDLESVIQRELSRLQSTNLNLSK